MPPLLISTAFTAGSYKIYLTDLTNLWCEDLDRRSILRRSLVEDTSIDPSQDSGQFKLFLEKIRLGLDGGKDVDLWLSLGTRASKAGPAHVKSLDINLSIALPGPLQPLKWTIELAPCPQSDFAAYFTLPLLQAQNARLRELESLVGILRDKDNVIQKLVDKLEATGAELGHVFPGAAGKGGRKIPRKVAEERVKGLGGFEQESWRDDMKKLEDKEGVNDTRAAIQGAFRNDLWVELLRTGAEVPRGWDSWWEQLKDKAMRLSTREEKEEDTKVIVKDLPDVSSPTNEEATEQENIEGDDDHFQVQATPPQPSSPQKSKTSSSYHTRARNVINDDFDDEDDLGAASQSQPSAIPDSFPTSRRGDLALPKKLGAIGGPKKTAKKPAKSPSPAPEPARMTKSQKPDEEDNDETATEDEDAAPPPRKSATPPKKASPPVTANPTKKGGIGKIGGKKKAASPSPASTPVDDVPIAEESQLPTKAPKSKLGRIGHKQANKAADDGEESRGRSEKKEEEEEKPRETSEERAQRKREELKRQLEEKAKAPAKKKRRF